MPRAKKYPGRLVHNERYHDKKMHWVWHYRRYGLDLGIYSDALDVFVSMLARRIKNKLQNIIVIEGYTGSGKSTLAIQLAMMLAQKLNTTFDLSKDYVYSVQDLRDKLSDPNASPISLFDEGSVSLNSQNFRKNADRDIVVLFDTMRSRGFTTIICIPSIKYLNPVVRREHVSFKLHCSSIDEPFVRGFDRGFVEICDKRVSKRKRNDPDPYWNVLFTGIFLELPPDIDREYQKIKSDRQDKLIEKIIKKED